MVCSVQCNYACLRCLMSTHCTCCTDAGGSMCSRMIVNRRPVLCGLFSYLFIHSCRGSSSDNSMSGFCHAVNVTSCPAGQTCSSLTGCSSLDTMPGQGELGRTLIILLISDHAGVVRTAGVSPVPARNTRGLLSSTGCLPHTEAAPAAAPPLPRLQDSHHVYTCRHV